MARAIRRSVEWPRKPKEASNVPFGLKADIGKARLMPALPPKADIGTQPRDVRFVPKADIQVAFGYYRWWARVLKFAEHHP